MGPYDTVCLEIEPVPLTKLKPIHRPLFPVPGHNTFVLEKTLLDQLFYFEV